LNGEICYSGIREREKSLDETGCVKEKRKMKLFLIPE
jgi:hypothetical protein